MGGGQSRLERGEPVFGGDYVADPRRDVWAATWARRRSATVCVFRHDNLAAVALLAAAIPVGDQPVVRPAAPLAIGPPDVDCVNPQVAYSPISADTTAPVLAAGVSVPYQRLPNRSIHSFLPGMSCGCLGRTRQRPVDRGQSGPDVRDDQAGSCDCPGCCPPRH